jgi:DnaJ family protein C protein 28
MPKYSIDEIIRQAMKEGKFDDLPGKGKPLNLDQNPHQDPEWRVAHHLLKSGGFSLPWIERLGEIDEELGGARSSLAISWDWQQNEHGDELDQEEWQASIDLFEDRVQTINEKIRAYNLEVPSPRFQVPLVDIDQELAQVMNNGDS